MLDLEKIIIRSTRGIEKRQGAFDVWAAGEARGDGDELGDISGIYRIYERLSWICTQLFRLSLHFLNVLQPVSFQLRS